MEHFLEVKNLRVSFTGDIQKSIAVDDVSYYAEPGEVVCFVGESGSGKSVTQLAALQLLPVPPAVIEGGEVWLEGVNIMQYKADSPQMRAVRGGEVGMIFQEPMTSLNPTMKIGRQVEEALKLHTNMSKKERQEKVLKALEDVELENPELLIKKYPYELSGGMRQRVMIAAAIVCRPKLLIADEPTTALDVNTQESILKLMKKLNQKYKMSILFISHNLRVVNEICSRVVVMKNGEIVEEGETEEIFKNPQHEYTKQLIEAIPTRVQKRKIVLK